MCIPKVVKNITLRVFDLMSWKNQAKQIRCYESCKCECRLDPIICNNKQKWSKDRCRCECKKIFHKKCDNDFIWNPSSCKCKYKRKAALLAEECENEVINNKTLPVKEHNKTVSIKEPDKCLNTSLDPCKPYVASSILFLLVSVIITGAFIYFYVNSQSKRKLQTYYG